MIETLKARGLSDGLDHVAGSSVGGIDAMALATRATGKTFTDIDYIDRLATQADLTDFERIDQHLGSVQTDGPDRTKRTATMLRTLIAFPLTDAAIGGDHRGLTPGHTSHSGQQMLRRLDHWAWVNVEAYFQRQSGKPSHDLGQSRTPPRERASRFSRRRRTPR
ncbi:MAG: hypothetical protein VX589_11160 [Myxococcota bacterium]|nr:hypothetical protein [Myxococcota bacterium]